MTFLFVQGDVKGYLRVAVQAILDEETVDYPMGIRQSATIAFPDVSSRLTEKRRRTQKQLTNDEDDDDDDTSDEREVDEERTDVAGSCDDKDNSNEKEIDTM